MIINNLGVAIGWSIILLWLLLLVFLLQWPLDFSSPLWFLFILLQTHLYTGLFITGHDAMHHVISKDKTINNYTGIIAIGLFAFNSYKKLFPKHHEHHRFTATDKDPDYHPGSFVGWYFNFLRQYVTVKQVLLMALTYNILILFFPATNVVLFWILPSILSTFQLFYFGTYLPHKGFHSEENIHKSNTQSKNHVVAFLTCYFFGYHYEHHNAPGVPWWKLYKEKE